jgi:bile acid:Na+ symporter, BASS family
MVGSVATLTAVAATGLAVHVVAAMLLVGLTSGSTGSTSALADRTRLAQLVVAGAAVAPLGAWAIASAVGLEEPLRVGLLVLGAAAGPPMLGTFGRRLGDGPGLPAGHTLLLTAVAIVVAPLLLAGAVAELRASDLLPPLAAGVVLPLAGGVVARARDEVGVLRLLPLVERTSLLALAGGGGLALVLGLPAVVRAVGTGAVLALVLFGAVVVAGSAVVGLRPPGRGVELAVLTLQRNVPVAVLLAITAFRSEPLVLVTVLGGVVLLRVLQVPFASLQRAGTAVGDGSSHTGGAEARRGTGAPPPATDAEDALLH